MMVIDTYFFFTERSVGRTALTSEYFQPICWPTVLLTCAAIRYALMDYIHDGVKRSPVTTFDRESFHGTW